jgi:hypothetical protein
MSDHHTISLFVGTGYIFIGVIFIACGIALLITR